MLVHSICFMKKGVDASLYYEAQKAIQDLQYYFRKFNGVNADEAMSRTLEHILSHFDKSKLSTTDIKPYVKKLARTILQEPRKDIPTEFIEDTTIDNSEHSMEAGANTVNPGVSNDFSDDITDKIYCDMESLNLMHKFILLNLEEYQKFCLEVRDGGRMLKGYSVEFRNGLYRMSKLITDLTAKLVSIYNENEEMFTKFISYSIGGIWYEADYNLISKVTSKRVRPLQKGYSKIFDMDICPFCVNGSKYIKNNNKRIYRVRYVDFWEELCDFLDSEQCSGMKCILGKYTLVKTGGGSISVINPDLFGIYDLIRDELLTNILRDTAYKLIGVGSQNFYLLGDGVVDTPSRVVNGVKIKFELEDITDTVEMLR